MEIEYIDTMPDKPTNYKCYICNKGLWRQDMVFGKWVFNIEQKFSSLTAPTFADQRNFFKGLFEAEWRNDQFTFKDGKTRPPQALKKAEMFKKWIEEELQGKRKGIPYGIHYYSKKEE